MDSGKRYIWVNGKILEDHLPVLPVETKGLMYGAGCFETLRSYQGRFLHFDRHMDRLRRGMEYLKIQSSAHVEVHSIKEAVISLIEKNQLEDRDALIRFQVSDSGNRGYRIDESQAPYIMITASPAGKYKEGYRLITASNRVIPDICRPSDLKLSNCLHYMQAWREARNLNVNDALMLTIEGIVAETSIANIFWKKENHIYTPSSNCDILPGIFRQVVLDVLDLMTSYQIHEGQFYPSDLEGADLVWVTNSVKQLQPVSSVNGKKLPSESKFYDELWQLLNEYIKRNLN